MVPVVHLAAINALQRQAVCNDLVHVHADGAVAETEQRDFAAAAHDGDELMEGGGVAGHFKAHVEALRQALLAHDLVDVLVFDVHGGVRAHFPREVKAVFVHVRDDHAARAGVFADARGDDADGPRAGDQHVLAHEGKHQGGVRGVADGIEEGHDVLRQGLVDQDDVARGDADVFGKGAVAVHAYAHVILAPLDVAGVAVAAAAAGDVALAANALADGKILHARAQRGDLSDILVTNDLRRPDVLLRPRIPFINMYVRAADGGLVYLDEHLARPRHGDGDAPQLQTLGGSRFDDGVHPFLHGESSLNTHKCARYKDEKHGLVYVTKTVYPFCTKMSMLSARESPPAAGKFQRLLPKREE